MRTKYFLAFILATIQVALYAQSNPYYYYKSNKVYVSIDKSALTISTFEEFQKQSLTSLNLKYFDLQNDVSQPINSTLKYATIEFQSEPNNTEYLQKITSIKNVSGIRTVYPNFIGKNGIKIGLSDYLYVKLKNSNDYSILHQKAIDFDLEIIGQNEFMPLWYTLRCTHNTIDNSLQVANTLYETELFASSIPDLMTDDLLCSNDPSFGDLWGLNNNTNPGIDVNVCNAWSITEGYGVNVAVLDQGIELNHNDLASNISPLSYDTESNSSPSQIYGGHGTHCAGTIGAIKDNNLQVVGVSPQSTLFSISNSLGANPNSRIKRADGINWAVDNNVDVISNSWESGIQYDVIDDAIDNALTNGRNGLGTVVVFAAGNGYGSPVVYPANSNEKILAVGSITSSGYRSSFSNIGSKLDVVAPGSAILSTWINNTTAYKDGTSMATPHVAGVAALILSVNPCLNVKQVNDIIELTCQKINGYSYTDNIHRTNGTWNEDMGYGLVDAHAAVLLAQQMYSSDVDLYIKDSPDDSGVEPNTITEKMWTSEDIWIRNNNDNSLEYQNPEYKSNQEPNYIKVRIINKSCETSTENDELIVNWAKANTALAYPEHWDGTLSNPNGYPLGGELPSVSIPSIEPGEEAIVTIPWVVPNPTHYLDNENPWHFCLLATIISSEDPLSFPFTTNPNIMVRNNNNQAWKNITIVDLETESGIVGGVVGVGNLFKEIRNHKLTFSLDNSETGKPLFEEAEITIEMDKVLFDTWEAGGKKTSNTRRGREINQVIVTGDNATLENLNFPVNERGSLYLSFNFLTKEISDKTRYVYHVIQQETENNEVIGGETYIIKKSERALFYADAGDDNEVDVSEPITISASEISEPAIYNWYDAEGNLIYQGKDLTVSTDVLQKYKLEIIAISDGFKDYDEVEVRIRPSILKSIVPNPSSDNITISYKLNDVSSAYLMVLGFYGSNASYNYILNTNTTETNIEISSYPQGFYTLVLVCDGEIVDAKTFVKQ